MNKEFKGVYLSWQDSLLARKITHSNMVNTLDKIWTKANEAYPRAVWEGWVDHGQTHVLSVLRNLDLLTPHYVYDEIDENEAFVLIAAIILHDIGMVPEENASVNLQYLSNLRHRHGAKGVEIICRDFKDLLVPPLRTLDLVCEIVKNHHGKFQPQYVAGLNYNIRADALWVRLADELDFGPNRAPTWLLDYIRPDEDSMKHWDIHNQIKEPSIDIELFRIQVRGTVENESFIRKLRAEFENSDSQELQRFFLSRGLPRIGHNKTFLIWDQTQIKVVPGEDSKEIDARPIIFSNDQFLLGARYLYNLGRYESAKKCFEDGINRLTGRWSDMPAIPYFYHYLKTLHALGHHEKALEIAEEYKETDFSPEIWAAVIASRSLGLWKLGKFNPAMSSLMDAAKLYNSLSQRNVKHKINEADAWVLYAIINLEAIRSLKAGEKLTLIDNIEKGLRNAEKLFSEFENKRPEVSESHYKGRYWGLRAFYRLLQIELDNSGNRKADVWNQALKFSRDAHGGDELANRNPFGAMCGKYCAAAVNYHKYEHCENQLEKQQALLESAKIIRDVRQTYDDLFGHTKKIFRLWPKIHCLFVLIKAALPKGSGGEEIMPVFPRNSEPAEEINIYTPLH